ncbi:MAG: DNA methyltransferase [Candidatus Cloacimonetes bacterium]|nr:DNA methyltransferase [Candidatus Cloacimonadota bacterium]
MKELAPRNRTITLNKGELSALKHKFYKLEKMSSIDDIKGKVICQDLFLCMHYLPEKSIDLLIVDPPYNLNKEFNETRFKKMHFKDYYNWVDSWLSVLISKVKDTGTIYVCCDWQSSSAIEMVLKKYLFVRNRITWEREKGRGAKTNWKNCSEDIWFATKSKDYVFNVEDVKITRRVIAPYRDENGNPKDWKETENGNFRVSFPSNLWTDITIPFWSMPENTDHPTQKPEKLIAKLILASSNEGDLVFDPFCGSGTTLVVAKKLNREFCGIEIDEYYCALSLKRIELAEIYNSIQGYHEGVFWERNTLNKQAPKSSSNIELNGDNQYEINFG